MMQIARLSAAGVALYLIAGAAEISAQRYLNDVKALADPSMKGRLTGTPELEKAAKYLVSRYEKLGIKPADGKSYFQWYDVTVNARMGKGNGLKWTSNGHTNALEPEKDFVPFNFSMNGTVTGPVVFAGYGITAPEYNYDDYAGVDAKDKIVMILRHEPQEFDEKSVFSRQGLYASRADGEQGGQREVSRRQGGGVCGGRIEPHRSGSARQVFAERGTGVQQVCRSCRCEPRRQSSGWRCRART